MDSESKGPRPSEIIDVLAVYHWKVYTRYSVKLFRNFKLKIIYILSLILVNYMLFNMRGEIWCNLGYRLKGQGQHWPKLHFDTPFAELLFFYDILLPDSWSQCSPEHIHTSTRLSGPYRWRRFGTGCYSTHRSLSRSADPCTPADRSSDRSSPGPETYSILWMPLFSWVPTFVDWTKITHLWG